MKDTRDHSPANLAAGRSCHYCERVERELRPYGPGGSWVCLPCATETPERDAETGANFGAILNANEAVSPLGATVLDAGGLRPLIPGDPVVALVEATLAPPDQNGEETP